MSADEAELPQGRTEMTVTEQASEPDPFADLPTWVQKLDASSAQLEFETRYRPVESIGAGGTSDVHLVHDGRIGREVAAKVLRSDIRGRENAAARFVLEACRQAQLEHPSIVPVHDIGITRDGQLYFTMKRVRGLTLAQILSKLRHGDPEMTAKFTRHKLLTAFNNICLTVAFAHERGFLHRDVKPANIMLGDYGETYLLDWGLAKPKGAESEESDATPDFDVPAPATLGMVGTPGYMSPEQIRGPAHWVSESADIYALGVTLFEILALEPLHDLTKTAAERMKSTLQGVETRLSVRAPHRNVPPELEAIVVKATALHARSRFATVRELSDALERFLDGDRDYRLRQSLAADQSAVAEKELLAAEEGTSEEEALHRSRAMQAVGKALALDPTNGGAMDILLKLLGRPPRSVPREVVESIEENEKKTRSTGHLRGAILCALLALTLTPVCLWFGVRDWSYLAPGLGLLVCLALGSLIASRWPTQPGWFGALLVVIANAACLCAGEAISPAFLTPMLIMLAVAIFANTRASFVRPLSLGLGLVVGLVPAILEIAKIVEPSYRFTGDGMFCFVPRAIHYPPTPMMSGCLVVIAGMVLFTWLGVVKTRDALDGAELRMALHSWHLKQLVPSALGAIAQGGRVEPSPTDRGFVPSSLVATKDTVTRWLAGTQQ